jgi:hypothetical protein
MKTAIPPRQQRRTERDTRHYKAKQLASLKKLDSLLRRTLGLILKAYWPERLLFPSLIGERYRSGRDYRHIFFLTDKQEIDLEAILKQALRRSLLAALLWLAASVWLFVEVYLSAIKHGWIAGGGA